MGIAVVAQVAQDYPEKPAAHRRAYEECWQHVAARYTEVLAAGAGTVR